MDIQNNYYIDYKKDHVQLWSKERLQFEPKGWQLRMRDDLKSSLLRMIASKNTILYACYASSIREDFDVENILFYNVGSSAFSNICKDNLIFERSFDNPPVIQKSQYQNISFDHYQCYKITSESALQYVWGKTKTIAKWDDSICSRLSADSKPHDVWFNMANDKIDVLDNKIVKSYFGLNIILQLPTSIRANLTGLIKPLLDGITSSFHTHNGYDINEITERLSILLNVNREAIYNKLMNNSKAILGECRLLFKYRNSVMWNPADKNLIFCKIYVKPTSGHLIKHSGSLFEVG